MATIPHVPNTPDPIHAAIARHRAAYDKFQVAPEGPASLTANNGYDAATDALVATPCATRFGALALLGHLRWWLAEEAEFSDWHQPGYGLARARAADLTLFLGTHLPPAAAPQAFPQGRLGPAAAIVASRRLLPGVDRCRQNTPSTLPNEALPGEVEPREAVTAVRPDTAHSRALRFLDAAGETFAALAIVIGGIALTGLASLL